MGTLGSSARGPLTPQLPLVSSFPLISAAWGESTSGLEPLAPASATSARSVVAGSCGGLRILHNQRVFCSLYCSLLQGIECRLGSN
jgi:hypothetical protein